MTEKNPEAISNAEINKFEFLNRIREYHVQEIPTDFEPNAVNSVSETLRNNNMFVLGEMHGVAENPNIIYTLMKKFNIKKLSLEWDTELKSTVEKYISSGDLDFDRIADSVDGRITAGHFALLSRLSHEGMLDDVQLFDVWDDDWNTNDQMMAKIILENADAPTLVVAGNLHAKAEQFLSDDDDPEAGYLHPMGEHISQVKPNTIFGSIRYLSGSYFNMEKKKFEEQQSGPSAKFYEKDGGFLYEIPVGHVAITPINIFDK